MPWITRIENGRWNVIAAAPDLDLGLAVLLDCLRLVESLQSAVVTLVEAPGGLDGNPHPVHLVENQPERADGALEDRRKRDIDRELFLQQLAAGLCSLPAALVRQVNVVPAGEQVLHVPDALAVTNQNQFPGHTWAPSGAVHYAPY